MTAHLFDPNPSAMSDFVIRWTMMPKAERDRVDVLTFMLAEVAAEYAASRWAQIAFPNAKAFAVYRFEAARAALRAEEDAELRALQ